MEMPTLKGMHMRQLVSGLIVLALAPGLAWANSKANAVIGTTSNSASFQQASSTANAAQETAPQQNNVSQGADTGKKSQSSAAAMNMMMAAALTAACLAPCPKCQMALCAMGALAAMQGMHDSGAAGQSSTTYDAGTDVGSVSTPTGDSSLSGGDSAFNSPILKEGQAAMSAAGIKVTEAGVMNADGSMTPASAFNSAASMAAAGIDPSAIEESQKIIADVNANPSGYKVASVAVDGGGGGGASSAVPDSNEGSVNGRSAGMSDADRKRLLAGKTVLFDGEPIGVRGENIFDMVHIAYDKKRSGKNFIESENQRPAARLPASVPK